jgi:hypothetical protein
VVSLLTPSLVVSLLTPSLVVSLLTPSLVVSWSNHERTRFAFNRLVVVGRERRHRERAGPKRIDRRRRAEAVGPHQRAEPRDERRELFRCRVRAREQPVLQHPARRRIDDDGDAIDGGSRRMRLQVEERERSQRAHVAHRRRQFQTPDAGLAWFDGFTTP